MTDAHKTDGLRRARVLQLVPLRRLGVQRRRPAARGDAPRRLAHPRRRRPPQAAGRRRARRRSRRLLGRGDRAPRKRIRSSRIERDEVAGLPPDDWDSVIVATGPLTSPALSEAVRALTGEARPRLLRRHRAGHPSRVDRHVDRLVPVALRQGGPGRHRRRLSQLPDDARGVRAPSSTRCSPATRRASRSGKPRRPISTAACRSR